MISEDQVKLLIKSAQHYMKEELGWNEKDIEIGIMYLALLQSALVQHHFPTGDKRFIEILRVLSNMLEEVIKNES